MPLYFSSMSTAPVKHWKYLTGWTCFRSLYVGAMGKPDLLEHEYPLTFLCKYRFKFVIQLKHYDYNEQFSQRLQVVLNPSYCRRRHRKCWCTMEIQGKQREETFFRVWRCPDVSRTWQLHYVTYNSYGYSELTASGVDSSNARVGCNFGELTQKILIIWSVSQSMFVVFLVIPSMIV